MVCRWIVTLGFREWRRATNALLYVGVLATCDAAALAGSPPGDKPSQAEQESTTLRIALVVDGPVSMPVIRTMRAEAERIWAPYGVQIHWLTPDLSMRSGPDLVALVGTRSWRCRPSRENEAQTLGCFQGQRGGDLRPVITVSPIRARQQVEAWMARFGARAPAWWLESRTGALLGRVLAHELGHYLVGSGHSATGLMREQFDAGDIWADEPEACSLTPGEVEHLASRPGRRASLDEAARPRLGPTLK
jgi:hypothetical protein